MTTQWWMCGQVEPWKCVCIRGTGKQRGSRPLLIWAPCHFFAHTQPSQLWTVSCLESKHATAILAPLWSDLDAHVHHLQYYLSDECLWDVSVSWACLLGNGPLPRACTWWESYKRFSDCTLLSPLPNKWQVPVGELSESSSGARVW
jgi:hypothetical protein